MDTCKFWSVYLPNKKIEGNVDSMFMAGTRTRLKYVEPPKPVTTNHLANFLDLENKVLNDPMIGPRTFKGMNRCLRMAASVPQIRFPCCLVPKKHDVCEQSLKMGPMEHMIENSLAYRFPVSTEVRKLGTQKFLSQLQTNRKMMEFDLMKEPFMKKYCTQTREKDDIRHVKREALDRGLKTLKEMEAVESKFGLYSPRQHVNLRLKQGYDKKERGLIEPCYSGPCKGMFKPVDQKQGLLVKAKAARDGFENALFYTNYYPGLPSPDHIDDILSNWWGEYSRLEVCNTYIMWLFPIPKDDGGNCYAYPLRDAERKIMTTDPAVVRRLIKAYRMMLDFYGFQMVNRKTGEIRRANHWLRRYTELASHSSQKVYVWIGRIMICLGIFGMEHYKRELLVFLMEELFSKRAFPDYMVNIMKNMWIPTLCKTDMNEFYHLFDVLTCHYFYKLVDTNILKKFKAFRKKKYLYDDQRGADMDRKLRTIVAKNQNKTSKYKRRKRRTKLKVNERGEIHESDETDEEKGKVIYQYGSDLSVNTDEGQSMPPQTKAVLKMIQRNKEMFEAEKKSKKMMLLYSTINKIRLDEDEKLYINTPAKMPKIFNVSPNVTSTDCEYVPYGI